MADSKIRLPSSSGGIMQYYDEYSSKINISPGMVVIITIVFAVLIVILHNIGKNIFGF